MTVYGQYDYESWKYILFQPCIAQGKNTTRFPTTYDVINTACFRRVLNNVPDRRSNKDSPLQLLFNTQFQLLFQNLKPGLMTEYKSISDISSNKNVALFGVYRPAKLLNKEAEKA